MCDTELDSLDSVTLTEALSIPIFAPIFLLFVWIDFLVQHPERYLSYHRKLFHCPSRNYHYPRVLALFDHHVYFNHDSTKHNDNPQLD